MAWSPSVSFEGMLYPECPWRKRAAPGRAYA
jgi:hypothetical protein